MSGVTFQDCREILAEIAARFHAGSLFQLKNATPTMVDSVVKCGLLGIIGVKNAQSGDSA